MSIERLSVAQPSTAPETGASATPHIQTEVLCNANVAEGSPTGASRGLQDHSPANPRGA